MSSDAITNTIFCRLKLKIVILRHFICGLLRKDEQMVLLIQRVSGQFHENFYFPLIAGVAYSFNPFVWNNRIIPEEGVLRLVFGLGTRAVEQHGNDYTRIVAINEPLLRPESNFDEVRRHTQKIVDVLDLEKNELESIEFEKVMPSIKDIPMEIFAQRDLENEEKAKSLNIKNYFPWVISFDNFLTETDFLKDMSEILKTLENAYNYPVDVEFTVNFADLNEFKMNIVQCRPFQVSQKVQNIQTPAEIKNENIIIKTSGPIIGQSILKNIDRLIYVVPEKYGIMPTLERYSVARLIGEIVNIEGRKSSIMLAGPGRWGTKMPELGIPVTFSEIRNASVLCEIVMMHEGLTPDISLGTHFFNDLVEMEIVYIAVFPKNINYIVNTDLIRKAPNRLAELLPSAGKFSDTLLVLNSNDIRSGSSLTIHVDALEQKSTLFLN